MLRRTRSPACIPPGRISSGLETLLADAERPLVVVGGAPWSAEAHAALTAWCGASGLSVASGLAPPGLRRQHLRCLRRASDARRRPAPGAAGARGRRPARDRRPPERDHDRRLHPPERAEPGPGPRARHRRPRRARARLQPRRSQSSPPRTRSRSRSPSWSRSTRLPGGLVPPRHVRSTSRTSGTTRCPASSTWAR